MTDKSDQTHDGLHYSYVNSSAPAVYVCISDPDGDEIGFLQGDEATDFMEEIEAVLNGTYPMGPFASAENALDYLLSQYTPDGE